MDIEKFGNIVVSIKRVLFPEGGTNGSRLLLYECAFICDCLLNWNEQTSDWSEAGLACSDALDEC